MINSSVEWNDLLLFLQVVERKGFTSAGEALGIPKSRLSRRVTLLEARLGTRLLQRSSRRLSLTDAGQALYAHCQVMLKEAEAGIAAVQQRSSRPMGKVRLSLPVGLAEMVAGTLLPRFLQCFPDVQVVVQATNRSVDLIAEQVDVVVRGVGTALRLDTSSLVQACVCTLHWSLVCSPAYREKIGPLNSLGDLEQADLLLYTPNDEGDTDLRLIDEQGVVHTLPMPIRLQSDNLGVLRQAALSDLGLCGLPSYLCAGDLASGQLVSVLPGWRPMAGHLVVLFPSRRGLAPAARALVDFLKTELPLLMANDPPRPPLPPLQPRG
jgi:DNA-binding transcriptional LysR family regulator